MLSIVSELDFQSLSSLMWSMCDLEINESFTVKDAVECLEAFFYTEDDVKAALNPQGQFIFDED